MSDQTSVQGMIVLPATRGAGATLDLLAALLEERGIALFARIDFARDAQRSRLELRAEQILIFGNPKAGTPLMAAKPSVGLDLPLKVLAWEDDRGQCFLAYNDASYIVARHGLDAALEKNLAAVVPLIERAAQG